MKKIGLSIIVLFAFALIFTPVNRAETVNFATSVSIPAATGVSITAVEVDAATGDFGATVTAFDFGTLTFDTDNGIWLPDRYYAVDIGVVGGAGTTDVTVSYTEGSKPIGQVEGLGYRATATLVRVLGSPGDQTEEDLTDHGPVNLLNDLIGAGEDIPGTDLNGGFFRAYVGIYPGGDAAVDAAGGAPFTNADKPGPYDGTVTFTATAV